MYFRHRFVDPATEKVCAQVLCRAFVYGTAVAASVVDPTSYLKRVCPAADGGFVDARELTKTMGLDDDRQG